MPRRTRKRRAPSPPPDEPRPPSYMAIEACRGKRRFATEREADDAAYRARMEGRQLAIYRCEICDGWHLTSRRPG